MHDPAPNWRAHAREIAICDWTRFLQFTRRVKTFARNHTSAGIFWIAAVFAACGHQSANAPGAVSPQVRDYQRTLTDVDIVGNNALSEKQIEKGLVNHGPMGFLHLDRARFNPGELANDAERILGAYRQFGYFDAAVDNIDVKRRARDRASIRFVIDEGLPVLVDRVKIEWQRPPTGAGADTTAELREQISDATLLYECCRRHTRHGDILNYSNYLDGKSRLVGFFGQKGYAFAEVDGRVEIDRSARQADVRFVVNPGPLVKFRQNLVLGANRLPVSVVLNRIAWDPGEVYDPDLIATTRGRLLRLRGISSVDIDLASQGRPEYADVSIRIYENMQREIRVGGGAAFDAVHWEARTRAEYSKNGAKIDRRLNFRAQVQPAIRWLRNGSDPTLGGEARLELERIDLFVPLLTGTAGADYQLDRYESYSVLGPEFRIGLARPILGEWLFAAAAWNMNLFTFPSVNPAIRADPEFARALGIDGGYRLGWYEQQLSIDRRDNAVDPHRGFYVSLGLEEAGAYAGSKLDEISATGDARVYFDPFDRLVLGARLTHARLLSRDTTLPITRRYFAGGATSQRGFSQRRLSPTLTTPRDDGMGVDIAYIGGDARVETSVEARLDLFRVLDDWFGMVAFLDGADVTEKPSDLDFGNLHWAAGLGVRLGTPVGPIRVDAGYRLNRYGMGEPDPGKRFAFHLSIGEAF
jgi:outer membrane protein assembly factor BamA